MLRVIFYTDNVTESPLKLLRSIPNLNLVPLDGAERCCGAAGVYNLLETANVPRRSEREALADQENRRCHSCHRESWLSDADQRRWQSMALAFASLLIQSNYSTSRISGQDSTKINDRRLPILIFPILIVESVATVIGGRHHD